MVTRNDELLGRGQSIAVLAGLLGDETRNPVLRGAAADSLGRFATPVSREALLGVLDDPLVARRAAYALARVGTEDDLADLRSTPSMAPTVRSGILFARRMISYRLGLMTDLIEDPEVIARLVTSRAREFDVRRVTDTRVLTQVMSGRESVVPLEPRSTLRIDCSGGTVVALAKQFCRAPELTQLREWNTVVGAVLASDPTNESLAVAMYLLAHPTPDGAVSLFGTHPDGQVLLFGDIEPDEHEAAFEVRSVAATDLVPMRFVGRFDLTTGRFGFSQAYATPSADGIAPIPENLERRSQSG